MQAPYGGLVDIKGTTVYVELETLRQNLYYHQSERDRCIGPADGLITVMAPARPSAMDEATKLRFGVLDKPIKTNGRLLERVVIMRDVDVSWGSRVPGNGEPELTPDDMDGEERARRREEWRRGAEKCHDLAKKLGVDAKAACPRTGEGVKEAIGDLVLQILEKRKAEEEKAQRPEGDSRQEDGKKQATGEKREQSYTSKLKGLLKTNMGDTGRKS